MIIEDNVEIGKEKIIKIKELLTDVKLPKRYKFDNDYCEIRTHDFLRDMFGSFAVAEIFLSEANTIQIIFCSSCKEDYEKLKDCFKNSKTKFKLSVGGEYY